MWCRLTEGGTDEQEVACGETSRRLAAGAGLGTVVALTPASASSYEINYDVTCHVYEQVELMGSPAHDWMRWYSTGDSAGCEAAIIRDVGSDQTLVGYKLITTTGTDASGWYYDGPGYTQQVVVWDRNGTAVYGPWN